MQLKIKPWATNSHPLHGILIKGAQLEGWVAAIHELDLQLNAVDIFPLPDQKANVVWGALVFLKKEHQVTIGKYEYCQLVQGILFIPAYAALTPFLSQAEIEKLLGGKRHLFHPEIGMVELSESIDWKTHLELPLENPKKVIRPMDSIVIPGQVKSYRKEAIPAEEVLKNMEDHVFPKQEKLKDKPLSFVENIRLKMYQQFLEENGKGGAADGSGRGGGIGFLPIGALGALANLLGIDGQAGNGNLRERLQKDFDDLEYRNKKELEKLMDLLDKNPEEALKYAIPLDGEGSSRGGAAGAFTMNRRWGNFSLFGKGISGGGGAVNMGDEFFKLRNQYLKTAEALIAKGDFEKAAFIYMKLLKDYRLAAQTLEKGKFYQKAASVYLEYVKDKAAAAKCYENGNYLTEAIELYKELEENEKVGDLYLRLNNIEEAHCYFEKVIEKLKKKDQFVKASLIYRKKMQSPERAQELLLSGWRNYKDAFNCLNNYFHNIPNKEERLKAIQSIHQELHQTNAVDFLRALKLEYRKSFSGKGPVRDMAYEVVAFLAANDPSVVLELGAFNERDKELMKDMIWYKRK